MQTPERRGVWWPGLAAMLVLAVAMLSGRTVWYADQWREWVLAAEPGFVTPGMDASVRLPAGMWIFEWVMRPWPVAPTPWRAIPVLLVVVGAVVAAGCRREGNRRASMAVAAAVLLPPFALFTQSGLASAAALALAAAAWAAAVATKGRQGWALAAAATAVYPAAAPTFAATSAWRLLRSRRQPPLAIARVSTMLLVAGAATLAAYRVVGTSPDRYVERLDLAGLPAGLVHAGGGPLPAALLALVVLGMMFRPRTREVAAAIALAWLVAGLGMASRGGPWSLLQPAFLVSGFLAALVLSLPPSRRLTWLLALAVLATALALAAAPPRQWRSGTLVTMGSDADLPAPISEAVLRWDVILAVLDEATSGREPMGEFGLPVRWAYEFERRTVLRSDRLHLETDVAGPWCQAGEVCRPSARAVESLGEGPVLMQFYVPRRVPKPIRPVFAACGDAAVRLRPDWHEVRVVDLWNMLGIVGRVDLPAGCFVPVPDLYAGEWQALQMDGGGAARRMRGDGARPHAPQRY